MMDRRNPRLAGVAEAFLALETLTWREMEALSAMVAEKLLARGVIANAQQLAPALLEASEAWRKDGSK